jgi:hypothetical protein
MRFSFFFFASRRGIRRCPGTATKVPGVGGAPKLLNGARTDHGHADDVAAAQDNAVLAAGVDAVPEPAAKHTHTQRIKSYRRI